MGCVKKLLLPAISLFLSSQTECFSFNDSPRMTVTRTLQIHDARSFPPFQLYATAPAEMETPSAPSLVEPIADNSYSNNPIKRIKHLITNLNANDEKTNLHEKSLKATGGVWKTKFLGKPAYGVSAYIPEITKNLTKAESQGLLISDWPESVLNTLGHSSLVAGNAASDKGRKVFLEAMSTRSILGQSLSGVEETVDAMKRHWQRCAETGETTTFADDVSAITYKVIAVAVFGPGSLTDGDMKQLREWTDTIAKGMFSFPIDKPIIRNIPFFRRYPRAMKARREMRELIINKIADREAVIAKNGADHESVGLLDAFLLEGGLEGDELLDFCVDNVILSIFAGYDTTASMSTNLILLLHDYATTEELEQIRSELNGFDFQSISASSAPVGGMLECVPSLKSAVYESFRFRPVVGSTFRKTTGPIQLGKVALPANTTIQWSHLHGSNSPTFFETRDRACPLRFLSTNEPPPFIFGYGKHKCPGQFLAHIELLLVMKAFLCNFDFSLIPDQNTKPTLPFNKPKSGLKLQLTAR